MTEQQGGLHVAIIMDGNGRWATSRGLPRVEGHRAGAETVRRVVEAAPEFGIKILTLYAFSSDNWQRPAGEVATLLQLFRTFLLTRSQECLKHGVRISVIGRRDRLPSPLMAAIRRAEGETATGKTLYLRIAVDYSGRDLIMRAAARLGTAEATRDVFSRLLGEAEHSLGPTPDVDLLIRTGGEQRLSDFLLWESAYAELVFTQRMWPEFAAADLEAAVKEFQTRERRFGRIPQVAAG